MPDIYLLIEGKQEGPYTEEQVRQSLAKGQIPADLPAWHEGLEDWVQIEGLLSSESDKLSLQNRRGDVEPAPEQQENSAQATDSSVPVVAEPNPRNGKLKYVWVGAACFVGLLVLGLSIGAGVGMILSRSKEPALQPTIVAEQPQAPSAPAISPPNDTREDFLKYIVHQLLDKRRSIPATSAHYTIQDVGDGSNRCLCELDYTIDVDTGTNDQGLVPGTLHPSYKAFFLYDGNKWKFLKIVDSNNDTLPDDNDMVGWIKDWTGWMWQAQKDAWHKGTLQ